MISRIATALRAVVALIAHPFGFIPRLIRMFRQPNQEHTMSTANIAPQPQPQTGTVAGSAPTGAAQPAAAPASDAGSAPTTTDPVAVMQQLQAARTELAAAKAAHQAAQAKVAGLKGIWQTVVSDVEADFASVESVVGNLIDEVKAVI